MNIRTLLAVSVVFVAPLAQAAPSIVNHQGRIAASGVSFDGTGHFKFALVDGGTNTNRVARATATVSNGFITGYTLTDRGRGYVQTPQVVIQDAQGRGARAVAVSAGGEVVAVNVINPGSGYVAPRVVIGVPTGPPTRRPIAEQEKRVVVMSFST